MKKPLLDSAVFIQYDRQINQGLIEKMKLSMVVLYELTATPVDKEYLQKTNNIRQIFIKEMI